MRSLRKPQQEREKISRARKTLSEGLMAVSLAVSIAACGAPPAPRTTTPRAEVAVRGLEPQKLNESEVVLLRDGDLLKAAVLEFERGDEGPDRLALQDCKTEFDICVNSLSTVRSIKGAHITFVTYRSGGWRAVGECEDVYANDERTMESASGPVRVHFAACDISGVEKGRSIMVAFFPEGNQAIDTSDTTYQKQ